MENVENENNINQEKDMSEPETMEDALDVQEGEEPHLEHAEGLVAHHAHGFLEVSAAEHEAGQLLVL